MIRDFVDFDRFVCFVFQGSLLCDRPVSGNNRLVIKFASPIFLIFLILVTCKSKATSVSFSSIKNPLTKAISCAILEQSRVILSQRRSERLPTVHCNQASWASTLHCDLH